MKLPMKFFDTKHSGDLFQRIDDHKRIEYFLTIQTLNILFSLFSFVVFSIALSIYSINIFLIFLLGSILSGVWSIAFLKKRRTLDYENFGLQGKNRNHIYQLVAGMQEIKLQKCEQRKRWEWEDIQADLFKINMKTLSIQQNQETGIFFINGLKNILITVLAATSVINGNLTIGMMLAVQYIIGQLNNPVEQIVNFIYQWQDVSISIDRMNEIHIQKNEENENINTVKLIEKSYDIQINNLCFKYDELSPNFNLNKINLTIPAKKVTAIVGSSGSGKTTFIKLLLGFYSPCEGNIDIGNTDLENLNLSWWRSVCGVVMQDGYLFSDTIARNIAIMDDSIDLERLKYAAKVANIDSFIEQLPLGYNTMIGQDGQGISHGQRQRILIARVVYKDPKFIFLDEATNSLDVNNEKVIVENLQAFYKNKTVVIVAHRLSTVRNANKIIVLDNGEIVEQGNHETLISAKGKYYKLVKNQLELGS
jgi:ATP-binding cassette subfamily B protein